MADYNVNMKQWNGTSFDNVLPLAYNAKQLGGQSLAEVKQWVQDNNLKLFTGSYVGTGTYGSSNPTVLQIGFEPKIVFFEFSYDANSAGLKLTSSGAGNYGNASFESNGFVLFNDGVKTYLPSTGSTGNLIKTFTENSLSFYYEGNSTGAAAMQFNHSGRTYWFVAIGGYDMGGATEWTITQSGTWTAPRTGRYYLELYGGGGGATNYGNLKNITGAVSGGSSCQSYSSINLTAGDSIAVSIGVGGTSDYSSVPTKTSTGTSFGSYSVSAGGMASVQSGTEAPSGGAAAGNLGTNGSYNPSYSSGALNYSNGTLKTLYGYGGWGGVSSSYSGGTSGGPGAVYLKYLGA